jgi:hypothetical protein
MELLSLKKFSDKKIENLKSIQGGCEKTTASCGHTDTKDCETGKITHE